MDLKIMHFFGKDLSLQSDQKDFRLRAADDIIDVDMTLL